MLCFDISPTETLFYFVSDSVRKYHYWVRPCYACLLHDVTKKISSLLIIVLLLLVICLYFFSSSHTEYPVGVVVVIADVVVVTVVVLCRACVSYQTFAALKAPVIREERVAALSLINNRIQFTISW